jgi:hypothetical protein
MLTMLLPDDTCPRTRRPGRPIVPFEVGLALLAFGLCLLYGLVFGYMVYVSLVEQAFSGHGHLHPYGSRPHFHSPAEWVLIVFPTVIAWSGTFSSAQYLARRWQRAG